MGQTRAVRLSLSDDLQRGRASVFFRLLLALPFLIWLAIWAIAAVLAAIVNWVATLVRGESPASLHGFLARFIRYATQVYAYVTLAAGPHPGFDAKPGYAVDLEIDPPAPQNRWTVFFRGILALPALLLASVIVGAGAVFRPRRGGRASQASGLIFTGAFLSWFYALARGRMDRGLRDVIAYGLSYGAQVWSYALLLTDRYPSSDPLTAIGPLPTREDPIQMDMQDDLRRSRLTVFFRLLLAIPHLFWLWLWGVAAFVVALVNWIVTLIRGRSPQRLHGFLSRYARYELHVVSFVLLVGNPFPGFTGKEGTYPVDLRVAAPRRQNRWTVLFRLVLAVPAFILGTAYGSVAYLAAFLGWFAALATGRMPLGLRNAGALSLRYGAQTYGYLFLLTASYPYSGPCIERPASAAPAEPVGTAPPAPAALP